VKEIFIKDQQNKEIQRKKRQGMDESSKNFTSTVMSNTQKDTMTNIDRTTDF